jgi:uncharacterized membrane protein
LRLKVCNGLPTYIKDISCNIKEFKKKKKNCIYLNSFYTFKEYFQYNDTQYIVFIAYILLYYLIEQYSKYNFKVKIKHCFIFCLYSFWLYYMTMLCFHDSMFTYYMCVHIHIDMYMTFDFFYISGSHVVLPVDHLKMNKTTLYYTYTRHSFTSYRTPKLEVNA